MSLELHGKSTNKLHQKTNMYKNNILLGPKLFDQKMDKYNT